LSAHLPGPAAKGNSFYLYLCPERPEQETHQTKAYETSFYPIRQVRHLCIKARKWLEAHNIAFDTRDIITQNPTEPELGSWLRDSSLPVQKFFNTSGLKYKELNLKDKVKTTPKDQLLALLASDGKLVKRPVLVLSDRVLVGFKEEEWAKTLL